MFTDIHFGRRNNSELHNKDCFNFVTWVCSLVTADPSIDHVVFLGDWHELRNAVNGLTLDYSYRAARLLNDLGLPIFFIVGNHDLYFRNNRNVFTTTPFESLSNFRIIDKITVVEEMGEKGGVVSPFLFEPEFPQLLEYRDYPVLFGHFEFKGFVITGDTVTKDHGPDHTLFKSFARIFSGHYHKRQLQDNVAYIGSTFPMDFSDANDAARGVGIFDYKSNKLTFIDWEDCPTYVVCKISEVLENPKKFLKERCTVKCYVDVDLTHEESIELRANWIKKYKLRELTLDEGFKMDENLDGDDSLEGDLVFDSIDNIIETKLNTISVDKIDSKELVKIYKGLKI
jgi:DNA repair exonuclease SbcCD nuclease subunit